MICDLHERGNRAWRSVLCKTFRGECGAVHAPRLLSIFRGTSAHGKGNRTLYICYKYAGCESVMFARCSNVADNLL